MGATTQQAGGAWSLPARAGRQQRELGGPLAQAQHTLRVPRNLAPAPACEGPARSTSRAHAGHSRPTFANAGRGLLSRQ